MTPRNRRNRRPRFNGADADHAATEQWLTRIRTDPHDGATVQFTGASIIGLPADITAIAIQAGPAPLTDYRPEPASFPALPAAPEPEPEPEPAAVLPPVEITMSPAIGDYLRLPVVWCEMPPCISWHHDPGSLGERDARDRALAHGWRIDALSRLACPGCQQTRADYQTPRPVKVQHPGVPRRWHEHGTLPTAETQDDLEARAAYARRIRREHPDWARAMADAMHRTAVTA